MEVTNDKITIMRAEAGVLVVGPDGFEPVVLEKTMKVLEEVRKRVNYLVPAYEDENKVVIFPVRSVDSEKPS